MIVKFSLLPHIVVWLYSVNTANSSTIPTTTASTSTDTSTTNATLACFDCSESFKYVWEPYTECQYYPDHAPLRTCLTAERFCRVERVTYRSMTVSIRRSCAEECWHGCYASGYGQTKLKCTSCCLTPKCNTGDTAVALRGESATHLLFCVIYLFQNYFV